jgi:hypothetical protein
MPLKIPMPPVLATPREAYIAGMKAGADRPTTRNASYRYFSTPLLRQAWETGLAHGRKHPAPDCRLL